MTGGEPEPRDLAVALASELLHGCGALSVSIALDAEPPAVIECERLGPVVVHELDTEHELPHDAAAGVALPELPLMRQLPPFDGDHRAAYALMGDDGAIEHRRVGYDHVRVPVALRAKFGDAPWVDVAEQRFETASLESA